MVSIMTGYSNFYGELLEKAANLLNCGMALWIRLTIVLDATNTGSR